MVANGGDHSGRVWPSFMRLNIIYPYYVTGNSLPRHLPKRYENTLTKRLGEEWGSFTNNHRKVETALIFIIMRLEKPIVVCSCNKILLSSKRGGLLLQAATQVKFIDVRLSERSLTRKSY